MQLSKIEIQGYKSIRDNQRLEFDNFNVLFGENNVGKSTLIDALRDYRNVFPVANQVSSGWAHSRNTGKEPEGEIRFELEFILDEEEHDEFIEQLKEEVEVGERQADRWKGNDELRIITHELILHSSPNESDPITGRSNVTGNFDGGEITLRKGGLAESNAEYIKYRKIEDPEFTDRRKGWVPLLKIMEESLESWRFIEAFREPSYRMIAQRELELHGSGMNLSQVLLTLRGENGDEFDRISEEYAKIMSGIDGIRARLPTGNETTVVVDEDAYDAGFELSEISAGSKEILMLITKIVLAEKGTDLLLVEEPELHLHPGAERRILDLIREVIGSSSDNLQVIVSTHSNIFVHHLDVNNIYRVERDGNTKISPTASSEVGADLRDLGYEYAGMFQSEAVVIVEGLTDRVALRTIGRRCGLDFDEQNIGILEMGSGSQLVKHSRPVVRLMNLFNIPFMFLCDSDIGDELQDEDGNPAEDPEEIEGRLIGHINSDSSRYDEWEKESVENIHAWREEELEFYILQDHVKVADCFGRRLSQDDVEEILEKNDDESPDDQLEAICMAARPELERESSSMEKRTDVTDIAESVRLEEIPPEFYDVLEQIGGLVDAQHIVDEERPNGGSE